MCLLSQGMKVGYLIPWSRAKDMALVPDRSKAWSEARRYEVSKRSHLSLPPRSNLLAQQ
jgi:hypothetical protein